MRLSSRTVTTTVRIVPDYANRPIALHIGGSTYRMEADEAIELATALADVVEELRTTGGTA